MADKIIEILQGEMVEIATVSGQNYYVRECGTELVVSGGENFSTRREARTFAQAALANGYATLEPVSYNPLSDAKVEQIPLADEATRKARWEASWRDDHLMSGAGFNEEE